MIQRIQSIFLLGAVVLYVLMFFMPVAGLPDVSSEVFIYGVVQTVAGNSETVISFWPLAVVCVLIPLVLLFTIFLYHRRTLQMRLCVNSILVMVITVAWMWYHVYELGAGVVLLKWSAMFPALAVLLTFLAHGRIRKDEQLVRASDRLR